MANADAKTRSKSSTGGGETGVRRTLRIAFVWNGTVHGEQILQGAEQAVLGSGSKALFPLPERADGTEEPNLTLLTPSGSGGHTLHLTPEMGGDVWIRNRRTQVRELLRTTKSVDLGPSDYGIVTLGTVAYFFQYVAPVRMLKRGSSSTDAGLISGVLLSVFLHIVAATLMFLAQRENPQQDSTELSRELMTKYLVTPPPPDPPPPPPERIQETPQPTKRDPAKTTKVTERRAEPNKNLPRLAREKLARVSEGPATVSALTKLLRAGPEGPSLNHVVSSTTFRSTGAGSPGAIGLANALSALPGGSVSTGGGGGGGSIATLGGDRATAGVGRLEARAGGGQVRGSVRSVTALARTTGSGLSRAQILEVIGRYQGRIQQCYERALNRNPGLAGRMTFEWQVTPAGSVANARQRDSTLGDNGVSTCITGVIRSMRFPRPSGGNVDVAFPFLFERAH